MTDQTTALSKAAVKAFYDSASRGDIDGCIATLHEDFEAAIPTCLPWTGVHKGPAAFRADVLPRLSSVLDLQSFSLDSLYGEDSRVFATVTVNALASGRTAIVGEDWTVINGKIIALRVYYFDPTVLLPSTL